MPAHGSTSQFYTSLIRPLNRRSEEDVNIIYTYLRKLEVFDRLHDDPLRSVCRTARLETRPANYVLYKKGQVATCWYILLAGSVVMDKQVYLPVGCFGKRSNMNLRRDSDCIVIQPADMIVIDYPDVQRITVHHTEMVARGMAISASSVLAKSDTNNNNTAATAAGQNCAVFYTAGVANFHIAPASVFQPRHAHNREMANSPHYSVAQTQHQQHTRPSSSSPVAAAVSAIADYNSARFGDSGGERISLNAIHLPANNKNAGQPVRLNANGLTRDVPIIQSSTSARGSAYHVQSQESAGTGYHGGYNPHPSFNYNYNYHHHHHIRSGSASDESAAGHPTTATYSHHKNLHGSPTSPTAMNATTIYTESNSQQMASSSSSTSSSMQLVNNFTGKPVKNVRRSFHMDELQHLETLRLVRRQQEQFSQAVFQQQERLKSPLPLPQLRYGKNWASRLPVPVPSHGRPSEGVIESQGSSLYIVDQLSSLSNDSNSTSTAVEENSNDINTTTLKRTTPKSAAVQSSQPPPPPLYQRQFHQRKCSDAASVGSESDGSGNHGATIVKVRSHYNTGNGYAGGTKRLLRARSITSSTSTADGDDLSGLPETAVDSDEEDDDEDDEESCPSHDSFQELRDNVRECLEKEPSERCADDISILMDFIQQMPALACLPLSIKRQLCLKMVFAIVPSAGTIIMQNGEKIDAWSVVVNGAVEHIRATTGERIEYRLGDCFGAQPNPQVQYQDGEMRTLVDDCEFVLVEHSDFCSIMCTLSEHIERESNDATGEVVREAERKVVGNHVELLTTKALPERLVQQLIEEADPPTGGGAAASSASASGSDVYFVEDFLLMYRVFIFEPTTIVHRLLDWFRQESDDVTKRRERVSRIFLLWVNNHFADFESDMEMMRLLNSFEKALESVGMHNQQSLLNITCSVKSKPRVVTLTRSNRAQELPFGVLGGAQPSRAGSFASSHGVFISHVEPNSQAEKNGLSRGDEILEMNGQSFRNVTLTRALDLLKESTHISLTLKSNLMGFKEMLTRQEDELAAATAQINVVPAGDGGKKRSAVRQGHNADANWRTRTDEYRQQQNASPHIGERHQTVCQTSSSLDVANHAMQYPSGPPSTSSGGGGTGKSSMFEKLFTLLKGSSVATHEHRHYYNNDNGYDSADEAFAPSSLRASRSNPDISSHIHPINLASSSAIAAAAVAAASTASNRHSSFSTGSGASVGGSAATGGSGQCEQAIKVYRGDQSYRYFIVQPDTSARSVVRMALQEFGIIDGASTAAAAANSADWALCECSVTREGVIKQRRLPDEMQNLAERIGLNSRFYLKNNSKSENFIPDELAPEVLKESRLSLYTLNAQFLATQLTYQDFAVFSSIDSTEYVNSVFNLEASGRNADWPHIRIFEKLFNREMWWVVTEICCERNVYRRSKLIKKFIKIARFCRDMRNFNSMFAIISGLDKPAVRRLVHSWERVSGKYMKMFEDIQQLMDPSRNMSKYRQPLQQAMFDPPGIPIYPVLRKDLIFAHEVKPTFSGKLVNFEKLRLIARIIRSHARLASVQYDTEMVTNQGAGLLNMGSASAMAVRKFAGAGGSTSRQGVTTSGSNAGQSARKKLYERTLMIRKVKAYLAEMPYIDCEAELDQRSLECEPLAPGTTSLGGGIAIGGGLDHMSASAGVAAMHKPTRRRMASPSPSSLSSHSTRSSNAAASAAAEFHHRQQQKIQAPKFGVESPQAVKKMLSLAQNTKLTKGGTLPPPPVASSHTSQSSADDPIFSQKPPKKSSTLGHHLKKIPSFNSNSGKKSNTATLTRRVDISAEQQQQPASSDERRID